MPLLLSRFLARLSRGGWATPIMVIVVVFTTSWPLMALAEPAGSELVEPANYWWYFVVTAATVGYGDFAPQSGLGHAVGVYVIVGGIAALTTLFTSLVGALERTKGRRMRGTVTVTASDHVVVLGYLTGRTERIVGQLLDDGERGVVLCAPDTVATHPMPDRDVVVFVRGELTDTEVLRRAGIQRARAVLVDADDDNSALAVATTVHHLTADTHLVVTLRDLDRAPLMRYVDENICCVRWHTPRMITEELTSPGITEVYTELMTHGGANTYSVTIPESIGPVPVGHCRTTLGREHGATVLAARTGGRLLVNPSWDSELSAGATLYYISDQRLTPEHVARALR